MAQGQSSKMSHRHTLVKANSHLSQRNGSQKQNKSWGGGGEQIISAILEALMLPVSLLLTSAEKLKLFFSSTSVSDPPQYISTLLQSSLTSQTIMCIQCNPKERIIYSLFAACLIGKRFLNPNENMSIILYQNSLSNH